MPIDEADIVLRKYKKQSKVQELTRTEGSLLQNGHRAKSLNGSKCQMLAGHKHHSLRCTSKETSN